MHNQLAAHRFTLDTFRVTALADPVVGTHTMPADSDDMLVFCGPVLGPTACLMWHRLARYLATIDTLTFEPAEFAATFGVMPAIATKAIARLMYFGIIRATPTGLAVRTHVPPFPLAWQRRLPAYLAESYRSAA